MSKRFMETTSPGPSVRTRDEFLRKHGLRYRFQGRIAGQDGKTKFTIENTSRTRIILADTSVDISFQFIAYNPEYFLFAEKFTSLALSKTSKSPATPSSH
jgi:hypothetical protein